MTIHHYGHLHAGSAPGAIRVRSDLRLWASVLCLLSLVACGKGDAKDAAKPEGKGDTAAEAKGAAKGEEKAPGDSAPAESHASVAASVEKAGTAVFTETADGTGVVTARSGHIASLSAPAPTRITEVRVAVGDRVHQGDNLVLFETTGFDAAVTSSDAALRAAEAAAQRAHRLVDAGVSPRKDAEVADAELAAARAGSVTARRAQQLARLQSPIDGVVTRVSAALGASADVGQTLVEIADTRALDVLLVLPPALAAKVRSGQAVTFGDASAADAETVADGKVADVSAVVDSASRGVVVRVAVASPKRTLRLGESLYGRVVTATHKGAVVIPDVALVPTGEGYQVFVVDSENKAHAQPVKVGGRNGHRVWISEGLEAGATVVTTGAFGMDDGATVVTGAPPAAGKDAKP